MRKILIFVLLFTYLISTAGCTSNLKEKEATIMINGQLYAKSKKEIDLDTNNLTEISKIDSVVDSTELPKKIIKRFVKNFLMQQYLRIQIILPF